MELHSIETICEGCDDEPRVMVVHVTVKPPYDCDPEKVIKYATTVLEAWGEEVVSARLYSIQPDEGRSIIGISCEV